MIVSMKKIKIISKIINKINNLIKLYFFRDRKEIAYKKWQKESGEDEYLRFEYQLNQDSIVFDIGGYKGDFTNEIIKRYNCNVYVFEPIKELYDIIYDRFSGNSKVHVLNFGLSDVTEESEIRLADNSSSLFLKKGILEKIKLVSISQFIKERNIDNIDLMKINIEGGEYKVIPELINKNLIKRIINLQIQFHDFINNADEKRIKIIDNLRMSHQRTYCFYMIWENWKLID